MILISHRGNLNGKNSEMENRPEYIEKVIKSGFDCEVDVWGFNKSFKNFSLKMSEFYLGHDGPEYKINSKFILDNSSKLWVHCKNLCALEVLIRFNSTFQSPNFIKFFYHETDRHTLTSNGLIWTYPNNLVGPYSILVKNEPKTEDINCYGICSDYIETYK